MSDTPAQFVPPVNSNQLLTFEYDGTNYIYDLPPKQNNLFWAGNFCEITSADTNDAVTPIANNRLENAQFRIQSVNFELPKIEYEENKILRLEYITKITVPHEVTITFLEDVYETIQQYHLKWFSNWYDRSRDCIPIGPTGKFRRLDIAKFHFINNSGLTLGQGGIQDIPSPEVICVYKLRGLMPKSLVPVKVAYGEDGNAETVSYTYSVIRASIEYNRHITRWLPNERERGAIGNILPTQGNYNEFYNDFKGVLL